MSDPWITQTDRLKRLHQALGLPSSALAADVTAIEEACRKAVDSIVEARAEAVNELHRQIDQAKKTVRKLNEVLGGSAVEIEAKLLEVDANAEASLPSRLLVLENLSARLQLRYDERRKVLRDVQLRYREIRASIGSTYELPEELAETIRIAEAKASASTTDEIEVIDETAVKAYEKGIELCQAEQKRRREALNEVFDELRFLHNELCLPVLYPQPSDIPAALLPEPPMLETRKFFAAYEKTLQDYLVANAAAGDVAIHPTKSDPTEELMTWARSLQTLWSAEKVRREQQIQTLYDQVEPVWQRLGYDADWINDFIETHCGLDTSVIRAYEAELARCREVRKERLGSFIEKVREEIQAYWEKLLYGEQTMAIFEPFFRDAYDEELLTQHEQEVVRLQQELEVKGPLLARAREWIDLKEKEIELEAKSKGPDRFNTRGGALLQEERLRKRITVLKPKLETELLNSIPTWEADHGVPFEIRDQRVLDLVEAEIEAKEHEKEARRKAKFGGASTPGRSASRPTTPGASTSRYAHTPGPATADRKRGAPMQTPSTIGTGKRTRLAATASLPVPRHAATTYGSPLPRGNTNLSRSCSDPAPLPALGISTAHNARSASHQHAIPVSKLASVLGKSEGRRPRRQSFKPRQSLIGPTTPGGGYAPDASLIMEEEF